MPENLRRAFVIQCVVACSLILFASTRTLRAESTVDSLKLDPSSVALHGPSASQQIIVSGRRDGRLVDLTRQVSFRSENPQVVSVDSAGLLTATGNGVVA